MRHGAHIALIPNQLSPVHRDMQIYMSLQLEGFQPHKRSFRDCCHRPKLKSFGCGVRP